MNVWGKLKHFDRDEYDYPDKMRMKLVRRLDLAREFAEVPFYITSSFRPDDDGAHGQGWAVDISDNMAGEDVGARWRYFAVWGLLEAGFRRVGVYDRHIHADLDPERDENVMWWGESS